MHSSVSRADVTSWLSAGGGVSVQENTVTRTTTTAPAMSFALGVGSSPMRAVVFGGLLRTTTLFSLGTDLNLSARVTTGGFARGGWGLALDLGPTLRLWRAGEYGTVPLHAMAYVGAPWGLELGLGGDILDLSGGNVARGVTAVLAVDLLRLTVMRRGATTAFWENPSPAGGPAR